MGKAENILDSMYSKLDDFLKTETVVGEPIVVDDIKLLPIITASFGLGGGFGQDEDDSSEGAGGGLGCKITPDAILVVKDGQVEMVPIKKKGSLEKLFEKMPTLVEKLSKIKEEKKADHPKEKEEKESE
ncbi:MAG: sporulation protein [Halanaerobiales bacterium]|nr:sporulation protein [Halanaerobiales bacterium]